MIAIGSDHAGFRLKEKIKDFLKKREVEFYDFGPENEDSVDYPDFGEKVAKAVSQGKAERGILICGSGLGMTIVANKFKGVRATLCHDEYTAKMSRAHNDSNLLTLGARVLDEEMALKIVEIWLDTPFEGGRHLRRLNKIKEIEDKNFIEGVSK
ncbi:ribose 5-phosphate isomerase B [SCandidatus Aminicenantes bacterium Aminicenantia_JdfR_composite]|jgi:ribose 5-phosphate isomerase B|nr:ribose 5-phosphate isomerase B [SCandidatus Aminicenantes bacterium Aminicenantia_JdfR_composite]MCP2606527.1 ribose 5-phosphate isomerase B [Candidatus Aminicenantes bacterium AC-708-I09]